MAAWGGSAAPRARSVASYSPGSCTDTGEARNAVNLEFVLEACSIPSGMKRRVLCALVLHGYLTSGYFSLLGTAVEWHPQQTNPKNPVVFCQPAAAWSSLSTSPPRLLRTSSNGLNSPLVINLGRICFVILTLTCLAVGPSIDL